MRYDTIKLLKTQIHGQVNNIFFVQQSSIQDKKLLTCIAFYDAVPDRILYNFKQLVIGFFFCGFKMKL